MFCYGLCFNNYEWRESLFFFISLITAISDWLVVVVDSLNLFPLLKSNFPICFHNFVTIIYGLPTNYLNYPDDCNISILCLYLSAHGLSTASNVSYYNFCGSKS